MKSIKYTINEKINSLAKELKINGDLLFTAIDYIVKRGLNHDDVFNREEEEAIEREILHHFMLEQMEVFERYYYKEMQSSSGINQVRKVAQLNKSVTKEEIEKLRITDMAKQILRGIKNPKKIHVYGMRKALSNIKEFNLEWAPYTIAQVAINHAGEEIDMMYESMGGCVAEKS